MFGGSAPSPSPPPAPPPPPANPPTFGDPAVAGAGQAARARAADSFAGSMAAQEIDKTQAPTNQKTLLGQ